VKAVNAAQASSKIADILGIPPQRVRYISRLLGEAGMIPRGSRGIYAHHVDEHELTMTVTGTMASYDITITANQTPTLMERIASLSAGNDPQIYLLGDDQTPTASGSFVVTLAQAIAGEHSEKTGPAQAIGLQFCRGQIRAWIEWKLLGRVYFGVRELPDGMLQEVSINSSAFDALRQIPTTRPSAATDGPDTTTPTRLQSGSAESVSSSLESPRDCNRDAPLVHRQNMREYSRERDKRQLDSGTDSPSSNRFSSERRSHGINPSHRRLASAQS